VEPHRLLQRIESPEDSAVIWCAQLEPTSSEEIAELAQLLDETERARAQRFRLERDRCRFIVAHGLLRLVLSETLGQLAGPFVYSANGKPSLTGENELQFNLSHSADLAVFALSHSRRVGIDLESAQSLAKSGSDLPAMAERIFSQDELSRWRALTAEHDRLNAFLRAWTRKEACLKTAGLRLDDMAAIETGFAVANGPQKIIIPASHPGAPLSLILHDLLVVILPRPATAATACAFALEND
jgi:4'-phosphopantetheinyl transferase